MQSAFKFESTAVPSGGRSDRGLGGQRGGARRSERREYKPKTEEGTDAAAAIPASDTSSVPATETASVDVTQSPAEKKSLSHLLFVICILLNIKKNDKLFLS